MCKEGGFNLTKFSSNSLDVLKTIQDKDRKDGVKSKDLAIGVLTEYKTLDYMLLLCHVRASE